jgi:hypothetical protein
MTLDREPVVGVMLTILIWIELGERIMKVKNGKIINNIANKELKNLEWIHSPNQRVEEGKETFFGPHYVLVAIR